MKVVADTNTIVSGLLWHGAPRQLLTAAEAGHAELITSTDLWAELADILARRKFHRRFREQRVNREQLLADPDARLTIITCLPLETPVVTADPDDDAVLACSWSATPTSVLPFRPQPIIFTNSSSVSVFTPSFLALSSFEPASAPTIR